MGFRFLQKPITLNDQNAYKVTRKKSNLLRAQRSAYVSFTNLLVRSDSSLLI